MRATDLLALAVLVLKVKKLLKKWKILGYFSSVYFYHFILFFNVTNSEFSGSRQGNELQGINNILKGSTCTFTSFSHNLNRKV